MSRRRLPLAASLGQPLRLALLLLVLGAFGVQQWAMQSHWHARVAQPAVASLDQSDTPGPATGHGKAPADNDCLWCHVASHGAAAAPPPAILLVAVAEHYFVRLPAGIESEFPAQPAHAWYSRGPPRA
jgi:hypothetical protein